ncbi:MAG TPA: SRPBCC family protein, partial [Blastococcus sp.]|nr:SRPBCC family protein [Blastococcus sp.]
MQLENSFTVPVPVDEAWRVLLDIERIAPCMPGAALDTVTEDDFTGQIKVKLGPINLTYQGKASIIEKDEAAHRAVIDARGRDQRGNGTATATVTAQLRAEGAATRVDVLTDLNITGRPAQFGRGVMTDVGNKLLGQFADKLAAQLGEGDAQGDAERASAAAGTKSSPAVKAAATVTGAVEEIAGSAEQVAGEGTVAKKAAAATRKAAASATDTVTGAAPEPPAPAKKPAAAKAAQPKAAQPTTAQPLTADTAASTSADARVVGAVPEPGDLVPAPADTAPAATATDTAPAASDTAP